MGKPVDLEPHRGDVSNNLLQSARVVDVIEVVYNVGKGTEDDPVRRVTRYFDRDGELLAERDPLGYLKARQGQTGG